jgi:hypothetical protein
MSRHCSGYERAKIALDHAKIELALHERCGDCRHLGYDSTLWKALR